jgi:hypothetical protein
MNRRIARPASVALFTFVLAGFAGPAGAHEQHGQGDLSMVVGFGTEPAYAGQPNSVQVVLEHAGEPVTDLGATLDVEVGFGDQTTALELEPFFGPGFGTPGDYRAWFIPTTAGRYTFHLVGSVDEEEIDETFTSSPDTFSDVLDPAEIQVPPVNAPGAADLATRIERTEARLQEAIDALESSAADPTDLAARADAASDDAATARTIGIAGILVGALGLLVAVAALAMSRRWTASG